jgi:membrane protease YdiL (CAAX protease family)
VSLSAFAVRVALATALAAALWLSLAPPHPPSRVHDALAAAVGTVAGAALFTVALRRAPIRARVGARAAVGTQLVLGLCAANEEVVWRRVLLGELLPAGAVAALAFSSIAFAAAHPRARPLHTLTGATFGVLYLLTGSLAASVAAHWTYNALVASVVQRVPP